MVLLKKLNIRVSLFLCDALRDLVPFAQFKERKKHPHRVLPLVKLQASGLSRFLNCTNGTKLREAFHLCIYFILFVCLKMHSTLARCS